MSEREPWQLDQQCHCGNWMSASGDQPGVSCGACGASVTVRWGRSAPEQPSDVAEGRAGAE